MYIGISTSMRFNLSSSEQGVTIDPNTFTDWIISFEQYGGVVIEKRKVDCTMSAPGSQTPYIDLVLSQDDTDKFEEGSISIQIVFKNQNNKWIDPSNTVKTKAYLLLREDMPTPKDGQTQS